MKYDQHQAKLSTLETDVVIIGIFEGEKPAAVLSSLDSGLAKTHSALIDQVDELAKSENFQAKASQMLALPTYSRKPAKKLIFVGLGKKENCSPGIWRKAAANLSRRCNNTNTNGIGNTSGISKVAIYVRTPAEKPPQARSRQDAKAKTVRDKESAAPQLVRYIQAIAEGWPLGNYSFNKYKTDSNKDRKKQEQTTSLTFLGLSLGTKEFTRACTVGDTIAEATNLARRLVAEPAAYMTPIRLAQEARIVANNFGLSCRIMNRQQIGKLGMGALLGVAQGAKAEPRFIVMRYTAPGAKKTVAFVGKGITFDSGGLSLKPAQSMETMKYDMAGAAAVIAAMQAVGKLKPAVSVLAVVAAAENMPGGNALHPGDVLFAMNGKTIEVNNTDAEGRLILADALYYAAKQNVDEIIDLATLTGAIVSALGKVAAGIMGSDQKLIDRLIAAGQQAGEKLWQLPLFEEYKESLKSDIADLKNAGARGEAGSACAAMFLKEFVDNTPWAHLDIAGPAWLDKDRDECNKGGTGFGVRTLCHYLLDL